MPERFRFPPRAYGPFSDNYVLPTGARGIQRIEYYANGTKGTFTDGVTNRECRTSIVRTGVRRVKPADLSPSVFSLSRETYSSSGMMQQRYQGYITGADRTGALFPTYGAMPADISDPGLKSLAEVAALLKLKSQSINLGVAFAERSRTAMLVGDSMLTILNSAVNFRRGNLKKAFKLLKAKPLRSQKITQQWLALQYGWKPLMGDVFGACEALAARDLIAFNVRVASRKTKKWEDHLLRPSSPGSTNFQWRETVKNELSYHVALNYSPTESIIRQFSSLGLTNPAEIIWELVPFSFVADWFVPVGSWLSSLDAANGWNFTSGTVTKRLVRRSSAFVNPIISKTTGHLNRFGDAELKAERKYVNRMLYANSPIPGRPRMKDPRSLTHMANAMALLVGFFSGGSLANLSRYR